MNKNLFRFIAARSDRRGDWSLREGGRFTPEHSTGWCGAGDCQVTATPRASSTGTAGAAGTQKIQPASPSFGTGQASTSSQGVWSQKVLGLSHGCWESWPIAIATGAHMTTTVFKNSPYLCILCRQNIHYLYLSMSAVQFVWGAH